VYSYIRVNQKSVKIMDRVLLMILRFLSFSVSVREFNVMSQRYYSYMFILRKYQPKYHAE